MTTGHTMKEPPFLTVVYTEGDVRRYEGWKHMSESGVKHVAGRTTATTRWF